MEKRAFNLTNLHFLLFERQQIVSLLENQDLWLEIPLSQRFAIVDSGEFMSLMGETFTAEARYVLESEIEAMVATIH